MGAEESVPFLTRGDLCVWNTNGRLVIVLDEEALGDWPVRCGEFAETRFGVHTIPINQLTYLPRSLYALYGIDGTMKGLVKYASSTWRYRVR
jgi:hypothetical protein